MAITQWIQLGMFAVKMIIKWGPKIWKLGNDVYHDIEGKRDIDGDALTSDQSANSYNQKAVRVVAGFTGKAYSPRNLNALREDVWKRNNIGSKPNLLKDARLRAMPVGKSPRRRR